MGIQIFTDIPDIVKHKNKLPFNNQLFICPSKKLDTIKSFNELERVSFLNFVDGDLEYNENGIEIIGIKTFFDNDGILQEKEIKGFVVYIVNEDGTILTSNGDKYLNSYIENNIVKYKIISTEDIQNKFIIKQVFNITNIIQVGVKISGDIYFDDIDKANKYVGAINFQSCEINSSYLILKINNKTIYYKNFDIFINGQLITAKHKDFFDYLCNNVKPYNNTKYSFDKKFKCIPVDYAFIPL